MLSIVAACHAFNAPSSRYLPPAPRVGVRANAVVFEMMADGLAAFMDKVKEEPAAVEFEQTMAAIEDG